MKIGSKRDKLEVFTLAGSVRDIDKTDTTDR
jgi:hypothetical protein